MTLSAAGPTFAGRESPFTASHLSFAWALLFFFSFVFFPRLPSPVGFPYVGLRHFMSTHIVGPVPTLARRTDKVKRRLLLKSFRHKT